MPGKRCYGRLTEKVYSPGGGVVPSAGGGDAGGCTYGELLIVWAVQLDINEMYSDKSNLRDGFCLLVKLWKKRGTPISGELLERVERGGPVMCLTWQGKKASPLQPLLKPNCILRP